MKVLVIIPARGSSKGVPGKNIMKFNGLPLINYTVSSALKSKLVNKIVVSSDDSKILEIANISDRIILHKRDKELAKKITALVKQSKSKTQASIQGDSVRITGKKRDELQAIIQLVKDQNYDIPLQFVNFRD